MRTPSTQRRPSRPRGTAGAKVDRERLRAALRCLERDPLLAILDRALDRLSERQLADLAEGYLRPELLRARATSLLSEVRRFCEASRRGDYYESFAVNSKNYMQRSLGTQRWIAECKRLFQLCVSEAASHPVVELRGALGLLLELVRYVDECHDDVVFWADEGGIHEVEVSWEKVLPVWFRALAATAQPEEYAREVLDALQRHVPSYLREPTLRQARAAATPTQRKALSGALSLPQRDGQARIR